MVIMYTQLIGSCQQFREVHTAGAIRESSPTVRTTTADPDDPGPAATEETTGEAIHTAAARAPIHTRSAQATGRQNGNPFSSI